MLIIAVREQTIAHRTRGAQGVPTIDRSGRFQVFTVKADGTSRLFASYVSEREAHQVAALFRGWGNAATVRERKA